MRTVIISLFAKLDVIKIGVPIGYDLRNTYKAMKILIIVLNSIETDLSRVSK